MLLSNNIEKNKTTIKPPLSIIGLNFFFKIILAVSNKNIFITSKVITSFFTFYIPLSQLKIMTT